MEQLAVLVCAKCGTEITPSDGYYNHPRGYLCKNCGEKPLITSIPLKVKLDSWELTVLEGMIGLLASSSGELLLLERLILLEFYQRKVGLFRFKKAKTLLSFKMSETIALRRILNGIRFSNIPGSNNLVYKLLDLIERK